MPVSQEEIKEREEDLSKRLDRATTYSTFFDKVLIDFTVVLFTATIIGFQTYKIQVNWFTYVFFIIFFLSVIFLFLGMFFSKRQKQININMQGKYIKWCKECHKITPEEDKKDEKDRKEVEKLGSSIEKFSTASTIGFFVTFILFMIMFLANIEKIL